MCFRSICRWELITDALDPASIKSSNALEDAILKYNVAGRFDFSGLHNYLEETIEEEEAEVFFSRILPPMMRMCLDLPAKITQPIPLLRRGHNKSITFSQTQVQKIMKIVTSTSQLSLLFLQIASLLANAFFCTYPRRNPPSHGRGNRGRGASQPHEYAAFPTINFNRLFAEFRSERSGDEKLKCIFNYFRRAANKAEKDEESLVTFERRSLPYSKLPQWETCVTTLTRLHVDARGTIEDDGYTMLQVRYNKHPMQSRSKTKYIFVAG
jgi:poly(ADP-ribose) glycohydrolase